LYYFGTATRKPLLVHGFGGALLGAASLGGSMSKSDSDYYAARLDEEWRAAKNAGCAEARAAHEAMADLYADRLVQALEPRATLHLVADQGG
jgi:hypothetical protein